MEPRPHFTLDYFVIKKTYPHNFITHQIMIHTVQDNEKKHYIGYTAAPGSSELIASNFGLNLKYA